MSSRVTQCPKCQTSFRVTDAQLDIANGAVRCGSCLHIFNASDHWLGKQTPSPSSEAPPAPSRKPSNESFDELLDDDDFLINDDSFHDDLFDDEELNIDDTITPDNTEQVPTKSSSVIQETDQALLEKNKLNVDIKTELSDSFLEMDGWEDSPTSIFNELNDVGDDTEDEDAEAWAEQLLADDDDEIDVKPTPSKPKFDLHPELLESSVPSMDEGPKLDPDLLALLNEDQEKEYQPYDDPGPIDDTDYLNELDHSSFSAGERIGDDANTHESTLDLLDQIEPEPVELATAASRNRKQALLWKTLIVATILALPLQYINANFDRLSRDPSYRPWFKTSCPLLGCTLPKLHDISQIKSSNLMVRSHPKTKSALVVDAMMTNRADFKQPFPLLELQFTDIDGQIVAGRRFSPDEYLAGELTGSQTMPSRQPIHVSLAIIDPGSAAVNYQLQFLPQ